jgi:hypothetical protein
MQVLCMAFDAQPGLTVDNMIKRNWTCDPLCSFYLCFRETFDHLFSQCNYTEAVWNLAAPRLWTWQLQFPVELGWTDQLDSPS